MDNYLDQCNADNLAEISRILSHIPHCVFYGTLLGLVRDGQLITGDDDVDFLVDESYRDEVIALLQKNGYEIELGNAINSTDHFFKLFVSRSGRDSQVDFYFYNVPARKNYIIERWNFYGLSRVTDVNSAIHIPTKLLFPFKQITVNGVKVSFPQQPRILCRWLYGNGWARPQKKNSEYHIHILFNRPFVVKHGFLYIAYKFVRRFFR